MPDPDSLRFCHPADSSRCATVLAMVDTGSNDCDLNQALIEPVLQHSALTRRMVCSLTEGRNCRLVKVQKHDGVVHAYSIIGSERIKRKLTEMPHPC